MKPIQHQVDGEKFIIYLSRYALCQGACDRGETSIQGNKNADLRFEYPTLAGCRRYPRPLLKPYACLQAECSRFFGRAATGLVCV